MRIAYVALYLDTNIAQGGVGEKITTQMKSWRDFGHTVRLFALSPDELSIEEARVFRYSPLSSIKALQIASRFISRSVAMSRLIGEVGRATPDLIYLRHGLYVFPLQRIFKLAPVVMELNSYDVSEFRFQGRFVYATNRLTRGMVFRRATGLVSVTHELAEKWANPKHAKPIRVIGNGMAVEDIPILSAPSNSRPVITMVASPGMTWHGVDKLISLGERCADLAIHIVGYEGRDIKGPLPQNVRFHGFLGREKIREILASSDVACGTLALHRKDMQEASPLKVREAAAYGIPLILGYKDTDLSDLETDCILQLPNTEDNVETHAGQIRAFAYKMMGKRLDSEAIRERISHRRKEEERLSFFDEIIRRHDR